MRIIHGEVIDNVKFFKEINDSDFLWKILPLLRSVNLVKGDILYWKGDNAYEFYFIVSGSIKLFTEQGYPFAKYSKGDMFGDSDALLDLPRDSKAITSTHVALKVLQTKDFETLIHDSADTCLKLILEARRKRDLHID